MGKAQSKWRRHPALFAAIFHCRFTLCLSALHFALCRSPATIAPALNPGAHRVAAI